MTIARRQHTVTTALTHFLFLSIFADCFLVATNTRKLEDKSVSATTSITIGIIDTISSAVLGEKSLVDQCSRLDAQARLVLQQKGFPCSLSLDAPSIFNLLSGILRAMSRDGGTTWLRKMIVVEFPNTNRLRDLSPTRVVAAPGMNSEALKQSGGGENFSKFPWNRVIFHT